MRQEPLPSRYDVATDTIHIDARSEVAEFATAMEAKLRKNDHKTGWKDQPIEAHIKLLRIEMMELDVALDHLGDEAAMKECVDVANFAMIIRDKLKARIAAKAQYQVTILTGPRPPDNQTAMRTPYQHGDVIK